jgi:hypothetical protein
MTKEKNNYKKVLVTLENAEDKPYNLDVCARPSGR